MFFHRLPSQKSLDFLEQTEPSRAMVLHVELFLVGQMVINTTLAENGKHTIVIAKEYVAKLLFSLFLLAVELFRVNFFPVFVDEPKEGRKTFKLIN